MEQLEQQKKNQSKKIRSEIFSWIRLILFALIFAFVLRTYVFRPVYVEGTSMNNTLVQGDMLILNKYQYFFAAPKRNDIVVLDMQINSKNSLIKRVIGLPGETIDFREGRVFINGVLLEEPEISVITNPGTVGDHIVLGENEYFVLGDNRTASFDSRFFDKVPRSKIMGITSFRFWPLDKIGVVQP
jgi:signal peptidase I